MHPFNCKINSKRFPMNIIQVCKWQAHYVNTYKAATGMLLRCRDYDGRRVRLDVGPATQQVPCGLGGWWRNVKGHGIAGVRRTKRFDAPDFSPGRSGTSQTLHRCFCDRVSPVNRSQCPVSILGSGAGARDKKRWRKHH